MILVTLGTQDKDFSRLLKVIEKEIENKNIKEEVIVQAGYTKYKSKNMKIFDLVSEDELEQLVNDCNLLITHGGVGSILLGIKAGKKVIATPRLKEYKEHTNNHQKQIVSEFAKLGYILELDDITKLNKVIKESKKFKPKKYKSNNKKFVSIIDKYIKDDNHTSWYNKYRNLTSFGYLGIFRTLINILIFSILFGKCNLYINIIVSFFITLLIEILFNFITNIHVKEKKKYILTKFISLILDINIMYIIKNHVNINLIEGKFISSFIILIVSVILVKYCYGDD